ncbi:MAG: PucR family transcriptional regulator ligand-binding domain-containing protein [Clostridiales Family XIII bacterium]|nr:PucR family transcriptional regulator ligand-binding domain-containing protein [Clostridiales Family XIII bacterium]
MESPMIKVSEILEAFNEYGFTLLAGEAGLNNRVASVSVLELDAGKQDPAWFIGNELVLSTLQAFPNASAVAESIDLLASHGVAALGVHQGAGSLLIDAGITEAANRRGFPLFTVPRQVPYSIIFTGVYERIFSKQIDRAVREAENKMRGNLYSGLLDGTVRAEEPVSVQAAKLGIPLRGAYCVAELQVHYKASVRCDDDKIADNAEQILEAARRGLACLHEKNAVIAKRDGCFIVLNLEKHTPQNYLDEHIRSVYDRIKEVAAKLPFSPEILLGVGRPQESLMRIALSGEQAGRAVRLGRRVAREQGIFYYGKMGVYSLLDVDSMDDFGANCARELEGIYQLCGESANTYFDTLEAYFDFGESMTAAAKHLDVHVNTIKYRINKLKEALGDDVFRDGQEKMRMYLLIKMRRLYDSY